MTRVRGENAYLLLPLATVAVTPDAASQQAPAHPSTQWRQLVVLIKITLLNTTRNPLGEWPCRGRMARVPHHPPRRHPIKTAPATAPSHEDRPSNHARLPQPPKPGASVMPITAIYGRQRHSYRSFQTVALAAWHQQPASNKHIHQSSLAARPPHTRAGSKRRGRQAGQHTKGPPSWGTQASKGSYYMRSLLK